MLTYLQTYSRYSGGSSSGSAPSAQPPIRFTFITAVPERSPDRFSPVPERIPDRFSPVPAVPSADEVAPTTQPPRLPPPTPATAVLPAAIPPRTPNSPVPRIANSPIPTVPVASEPLIRRPQLLQENEIESNAGPAARSTTQPAPAQEQEEEPLRNRKVGERNYLHTCTPEHQGFVLLFCR